MRWVAMVMAVMLLAACTGKPGDEKGNETTIPSTAEPEPTTTTTPPPPVQPVTPDLVKEWSVVSHATGAAALRVSLVAPKSTACDVFFAVYHPTAYAADSDLSAEIDADGAYVWSFGGDSRNGDETHVQAGGVDSRAVTNPVFEAVFGTYYDVLGIGDTFTSWVGLRQFPIEKGAVYNFTVQALRGLDGGPEETLGGSMRLAGVCSKGVRLADAWEDGDPLWLMTSSMKGDTNVNVEPFLLGVHQGSIDHVTMNATTVLVYAAGFGNVKVDVSGPVNESFERSGKLPLTYEQAAFPGGPGTYHLEWDCVTAGLAGFGIRVQSFGPLPSTAIMTDAQLPF